MKNSVFKKFFFHSWKKYIIAFVIALAITIVGLVLNGFYLLINYANSVFIAGFSVICIGGFSVVNYLGGYDFISYSFARRNKDGIKLQYSTYIENKETKRKANNLPFGPYFVVGFIFLLVSLIFYLIIL
jgi:prepilin signal peptidase PulO-like enzyme (type II secretory pathway)